MKSTIYSMMAICLLSVAVSPVAEAKSSAHRTFSGNVVHVSDANIKVQGVEGGKMQTLSFFITQGTKLRKKVHPGEYVKITFDQKFLGARHADAIDPYGSTAMKLKS